MKKSIVQWCKEKDEAGNDLKLVWEGGGDSGWVYFTMDGETIENEYTECLVEHMNTTLSYGSWAGEFNANGEAIYDAQENAFIGVDYYGEDTSEVLESDITIRVPKSLWYDSLNVEVEANYDETPNMSVSFHLKNGFITEQHTDFCRNLETTLQSHFDDLFSSYSSKHNYEFRSCTEHWSLEKDDAIDSTDDLIFKITQVDIQVMTNDERSVVLELDEETANAIDEQLNEEEHAG